MIKYRTFDGTICNQIVVYEVRMANALLFLSLGHLTNGPSKKLKKREFLGHKSKKASFVTVAALL